MPAPRSQSASINCVCVFAVEFLLHFSSHCAVRHVHVLSYVLHACHRTNIEPVQMSVYRRCKRHWMDIIYIFPWEYKTMKYWSKHRKWKIKYRPRTDTRLLSVCVAVKKMLISWSNFACTIISHSAMKWTLSVCLSACVHVYVYVYFSLIIFFSNQFVLVASLGRPGRRKYMRPQSNQSFILEPRVYRIYR